MVCALLALVVLSLWGYEDFRTKAGSIEQLELIVEGFESDGDCAILRYGDTQILIDSAENSEAFVQISNHMREKIADDKGQIWDYVIFTHPDSDHIGNAVRVIDYIYDSGWEIGTIIDYGQANKNTDVAKRYEEKVSEVNKKYDISYFDASSLSRTNRVKEYKFSENCKLLILYHEAFKNPTSNDLSVCCLIEIGNQKVLFTGDLEEAGEKNLLENHKELLDGVTFFKAGHHGSATSNTEDFIDLIRPEYVSITLEKNASGQDLSLNHFLKYTDNIFPSYVMYWGKYYKLFGTTTYWFDGGNTEVITECNNVTNGEKGNLRNATITLADNSDYVWYDARLRESDELSDEVMVYTFDEGINSHCNCTLIKYGNYDILIDCGSTVTDSVAFIEKLKKYVVDGKIEYVIVSHYHVANISQLIGRYEKKISQKDGVLDSFEIGKIIDGGMTNLGDAGDIGFYKKYIDKVSQGKNRKTLMAFECFTEEIIPDKLTLKVVGNNGKFSEDENDYSLATIISFKNEKMVFVGDMTDYSLLIEKYSSDISGVAFLRLSNATDFPSKSYEQFASVAKPKYSVIGSPLGYTMSNGKIFMSNRDLMALLNMFKSIGRSNIYFSGYIDASKVYFPCNRDLIFRMGSINNNMYFHMESSNGRNCKLQCIEELKIE